MKKTEVQEKAKAAPTAQEVVIAPPRFQRGTFQITGTAPYVQLKFSHKAMQIMADKMAQGHQAKKGKKREARSFADDYKAGLHRTEDGKHGIPAAAFRNALISACRVVGFQMVKAKLSVFVESDGVDAEDGTPLVFINGKPEMAVHHVRNASGVADLRVRGMWREWSAQVRVQWDADQFSVSDVSNLFARAGMQVGIGEGRPDSKTSSGMGWGLFKVEA